MATLTLSACKRSPLRPVLTLLLVVLGACRAAPPPSLAHATAAKGAAARAKAFMRVAVQGREAERARAALLWGLYACDARAPLAGLAGFNLARPTGGLARLAARRLEDALAASRSPLAGWTAAVRAPWLAADDRTRLRLRGAETLLARGAAGDACALAPDPNELAGEARARALGVVARSGDSAAAAAKRRLAVEFPQLFDALAGPGGAAPLTASFSAAEWATNAAAWLEAGQPQAALRAAGRAGPAGFVIAARAAIRLHRPAAALAWAQRGGNRCGACLVEYAQAERQLAWGATASLRARGFAEMLRAAKRADEIVPSSDPLHARGEVLEAEALVELGRFSDALPHLAGDAAAAQPRFEWVCRRLVMLQSREGRVWPAGIAVPARSERGRRLAAFWRALALARGGDRSGLTALAGSGFPDLPAQWAAEALGRSGVAATPSEERLAVPPPPPWAGDLMAAGRVADVVFAWRAELEAGGADTRGWLGLAALAAMPPLEAIPLLVRGEPRLLAGPWQGVSRDLLERYLPLPWRAEIEAAARRTGVPPWVLAGLVRQESAWNPRARSGAGALGLAQVLPDVAAEAARTVPGGAPPGDLFQPDRNLTLGAALLAHLRPVFGGSWTAALASYNAGTNRVLEAWNRCGRRDGPEFVESLEIPETWDYVHRVVLLAEGYRILYWPEGRPYPWT
ncbi:MAG: lytic transglycosylase domain-containing protein [Thermoanaerobaculaceae bacterium]|nr:lytic transglycosylase domain-containing protein [Thermoanaerobaculaceae bacterium]